MDVISMDYFSQLIALQPPGRALPRIPESAWGRLMMALADGFGRVDARSEELVRESDPRSCRELITDWERVCGLPGACPPDGAENNLPLRRSAVLNVLIRAGGRPPAYFAWLAKNAGIDIEIMEHRPFMAGISRCGGELGGDELSRFYWSVVIGGRLARFRCGAGTCGEPLSSCSPAREFECLLRLAQPAHAKLIVTYA